MNVLKSFCIVFDNFSQIKWEGGLCEINTCMVCTECSGSVGRVLDWGTLCQRVVGSRLTKVTCHSVVSLYLLLSTDSTQEDLKIIPT